MSADPAPSISQEAPIAWCIRDPRASDQGFVASTWVKQMAMVDRDYTAGKRWGQAGRHVDLVFDRPDTKLLVCHEGGNLDRILGWVIRSTLPGVPVVHFAFARQELRRRGMATAMLRRAGIDRDTEFVITSTGPQTAIMRSKYQRSAQMLLSRFLGVSAIP